MKEALYAGLLLEDARSLTDLDEVSVGFTHVAADLGSAIDRGSQKGRTLR